MYSKKNEQDLFLLVNLYNNIKNAITNYISLNQNHKYYFRVFVQYKTNLYSKS